jgi:hypothetical protein
VRSIFDYDTLGTSTAGEEGFLIIYHTYIHPSRQAKRVQLSLNKQGKDVLFENLWSVDVMEVKNRFFAQVDTRNDMFSHHSL